MSLLLMFVDIQSGAVQWRNARPKAGGPDVLAYLVDSTLRFPSGIDVSWDQVDNIYFIRIDGVLTQIVVGEWIVLPPDGHVALLSQAQFDAAYDLI